MFRGMTARELLAAHAVTQDAYERANGSSVSVEWNEEMRTYLTVPRLEFSEYRKKLMEEIARRTSPLAILAMMAERDEDPYRDTDDDD